MRKAIVLVSGGMDSLVCTALAARSCDELYLLHVNYGQRTQAKELECFGKLTDFYHPVEAKIVDLNWLAELKGSALTDSSISIRDYDASPEIPNTYVPYRNANLLCMAVSWAEVISAGKIYIGAVEIDSSGYPDCRKSFFVAMQKAIDTGSLSGSKIQIETPLIDLSKAEIVKLGYSLNAPFELSWSCYRDNDLACGSCDSCVLRLKAFAGAGIPDPISYQRR